MFIISILASLDRFSNSNSSSSNNYNKYHYYYPHYHCYHHHKKTLQVECTEVSKVLHPIVYCVEFVVVNFRIVNFDFPQFPTNPESHCQIVGITDCHAEHIPTEIDSAKFHLRKLFSLAVWPKFLKTTFTNETWSTILPTFILIFSKQTRDEIPKFWKWFRIGYILRNWLSAVPTA